MITILIGVASDVERAGVKAILERERDMRVVAETGNGRDAVAMAMQRKPDVALLAVLMPELNGVGAAKQIHGKLPSCKVVGICSEPDPQMVRRMFSAGACGYLSKEHTGAHVARAVRDVCSGSIHVEPTTANAILADYRSILTGERTPRLWSLTFREREVLQLIAEGKTTKGIAVLLGISPKTVEAHRSNIMAKLDLYSVAELTKFAIDEHITPAR